MNDRFGGSLSQDVAHTPSTSEPKRRPSLARWIPAALLVAAGAAIGGFALVRIVRAVRGPVVVELRDGSSPATGAGSELKAPGLELIEEQAIAQVIEWLAAPERGGRDTPSLGLTESQAFVREAFEANGLVSPSGADGFMHGFSAETVAFGSVELSAPDPASCALSVEGARDFVLGADYVPLANDTYGGAVEGPLLFAGYGVDNETEGYDDFVGIDVTGAVAVILGGEPTFGDAFQGDELTAEASIWNKVDALERQGAAGVLIVRAAGAAGPLEYRSGRARWVPPSFDKVRSGLPTLEISRDAAALLLGVEPARLEEAITAAKGPLSAAMRVRQGLRVAEAGARCRVEASVVRGPQVLRNVVGVIPGLDPNAGTIIVGAHLDHVGEGPRGRVGYGADDNASGVAALLGLVDVFAANPTEATLLFACFCGEEDGLLGSRALAQDLEQLGVPAPFVAMVNLDMIGRGDASEVIVFRDAPRTAGREMLDAALAQIVPSEAHGLARVRRVDHSSFFQRSDQASFFEVGIPSVFLFEQWPHVPDGIYHTWNDTLENVDTLKVTRTAKFAALLVARLAARVE